MFLSFYLQYLSSFKESTCDLAYFPFQTSSSSGLSPTTIILQLASNILLLSYYILIIMLVQQQYIYYKEVIIFLVMVSVTINYYFVSYPALPRRETVLVSYYDTTNEDKISSISVPLFCFVSLSSSPLCRFSSL